MIFLYRHKPAYPTIFHPTTVKTNGDKLKTHLFTENVTEQQKLKTEMKCQSKCKEMNTLSFCCILTVARLLLSFFMSRTTSNSSSTPTLSTSALSNISCSHVLSWHHQGQQSPLDIIIVIIVGNDAITVTSVTWALYKSMDHREETVIREWWVKSAHHK